MSTSVSAALEVEGRTLRYAEVGHENGEPQVLRLGQRTLEFDAGQHLLYEEDSRSLSGLAAAISSAFPDTSADHAAVVVHPTDVCSFFLPVPAEVSARDRKQQVLQQVALLTGIRSTEDVHLQAQNVRKGADRQDRELVWLHVLVLRKEAHRRVGRLLDAISVSSYDWMLSTEAAGRVAAQDVATEEEDRETVFGLAVGQYAHHTEYTLVRDGAWYHSHHASDLEVPQDRVYHIVALLNRLDVSLSKVGRLFVYGERPPHSFGVFEAIFQTEAEPLRPSHTVAGWQERVDPATEGLYVPCVGAAL